MTFTGIFVLAIIAVASAKYSLDFEEKGNKYTETIVIDKKNGIVETDVPQHARVEAGKYLTDFNMRLSVMKLDRLKKCYVMSIPDDESTPDEIETGLKKVHGKFPKNKYWIENLNILPVAEMDPSSLSKEIKTFCGNYKIIKVVQSEEKDMETIALAAAKASKAGRSKRADRTVTEFIACDNASQYTIAKCPGNKLIVKCKFVVGETCVYKVGCKLTSTGWSCPGVHAFHILHCCDYDCKP